MANFKSFSKNVTLIFDLDITDDFDLVQKKRSYLSLGQC